jgi:hypothetical protein
MVNAQPTLQLRTRWFPTKVSGERSMLMEIEFAVNARSDKGEPSIAEIAWATGNIQQALAELPPIVPPRVRREFEHLLRPWREVRYTDAYRRTGGILNLFTPPWGEQQDEVWNDMQSEWKVSTFADENARRAALAELEQRWNNTPHPCFTGLTPAQVMIGGGAQEAKLADESLMKIEKAFGKREFAGEGDMLIKTLMLLRGWQVEPQRNGKTPMQIILAERSELLNRRAQVLSERKG